MDEGGQDEAAERIKKRAFSRMNKTLKCFGGRSHCPVMVSWVFVPFTHSWVPRFVAHFPSYFLRIRKGEPFPSGVRPADTQRGRWVSPIFVTSEADPPSPAWTSTSCSAWGQGCGAVCHICHYIPLQGHCLHAVDSQARSHPNTKPPSPHAPTQLTSSGGDSWHPLPSPHSHGPSSQRHRQCQEPGTRVHCFSLDAKDFLRRCLT